MPQQGASQGDALALPAGQSAVPAVEDGVVALRKLLDEVVRVHFLGCRYDLIDLGPWPPVADVVGDA